MKCSTGKRVYASREDAQQSLIHARGRFAYADGHGPVAVYQCDSCGFYHMTSKGETDQALKAKMKDGSLARQQEAEKWIEKFNRKK